MVDDRTLFGVVNDLHGDELGAKGQNIEVCLGSLVLIHHFWDGLAFHSPAGELENRDTILLCLCGCSGEIINDIKIKTRAAANKISSQYYPKIKYCFTVKVHKIKGKDDYCLVCLINAKWF